MNARRIVFAVALAAVSVLVVTLRGQAQGAPCKVPGAFPGTTEDRLCVYLPRIDVPPSPTPIPTATPTPTPYLSSAERQFRDACSEAGHGILEPEVGASSFENMIDAEPGGSWAWAWNEAVNTVTGRRFQFVSDTDVVAHTGRSSFVIDGIGYQADPEREYLGEFDLTGFRSGVIGLVGSMDKQRVVAAWKVSFWLWLERTVGSSRFDYMYVRLRDCTTSMGDRCKSGYQLGSAQTLPLQQYGSNQWHRIEVVAVPTEFGYRESTFGSIGFDLGVFGDGARAYIDDVSLQVCGAEENRFGPLEWP